MYFHLEVARLYDGAEAFVAPAFQSLKVYEIMKIVRLVFDSLRLFFFYLDDELLHAVRS